MNYNESLGLVRYLITTGISLQDAVNNPAIPSEFRSQILENMKEEENIILQPANMIIDDSEYTEWLKNEDRSEWYYWPSLRQYLLTRKGWSNPAVQSLDKETDKILSLLAQPNQEKPFDKRGLVLGYVQSGKTSNYTALIAKAVDSGYRLIIVLAGTDNGLRLQTHRRLKKELVGRSDGRGVQLPPFGKQWFEFTRDELDGDFKPGYVNTAALQGSQPVLLVIKKNGAVLRRLLNWLESASEESMKTIPLLVVDDEADLASVDTRGSYQTEEESLPDDYESPSVINGLIRNLLNKFNRKVYVAYTATPFANVLIPSDNYDPRVSDDLYPRNFIVDLPKPQGYFGAEELFGGMNDSSEEETGLDVIRPISEKDLNDLQEHKIPLIMERAILNFILSGATKAYREQKDFPATMLIHINLRIIDQLQLSDAVDKKFTELRDEWRYARKGGIYEQLSEIWEEDFKPLINSQYQEGDISFDDLEHYISTFFESVQVKTINSASGEILDYETEPNLKAIAIGGNKLSRGLTLEGLLISFFARRSIQYDTLMQMGRWFGFREGYEDLTRIYTTSELAQWFSDLADIEYGLREDIKIYEEEHLTPLEVGMRIKAHPIMKVTSASKRRFANETVISQSYSGQCPQTIIFPLGKPDILASQADQNLSVVKEFISQFGECKFDKKRPIWSGIPAEKIIEFLRRFKVDENSHSFSSQLIIPYIESSNENEELKEWTVAICGRESPSEDMGVVDWGIGNAKINQISRSRIADTNTVKAIVSPGDEMMGLLPEEIEKANKYAKEEKVTKNKAARKIRSAREGLILLYPISKNSKPEKEKGIRRPLYHNPDDSLARDLIGVAVSFPYSNQLPVTEKYVVGTVPWERSEDV